MTPDLNEISDIPNKTKEFNHKPQSKSGNDISVLNVNEIGTDYTFKHEVVWGNAIGFLILHLLCLLGLGIAFSGGVSLRTFLWSKYEIR